MLANRREEHFVHKLTLKRHQEAYDATDAEDPANPINLSQDLSPCEA
jgi:hypothetical protein